MKFTKEEIETLEEVLETGLLETYHENGQEQLDIICKRLKPVLKKINESGLGTIKPLIIT